MSNPRRFGSVILHRVTDAMPLDRAKKEAKKLRDSGIRARVDTYQGAYAVWSTKKAPRLDSPFPTSKSKTTSRKSIIPKGKLGKNKSTTSYFCSLFPIRITFKHEGRNTDTGFYDIEFSNGSFLSVYESQTHLEVLIIHVPKDIQNRGWGTTLIKTLKKYCDVKKIGLAFRDVTNTKFFNKFKWLKRINSQYNPIYVYKVKANQLVVASGMKRAPRKTKKKTTKLVTLYHGTDSIVLDEILKSSNVIGWWSMDTLKGKPYGEPVRYAHSRYNQLTSSKQKTASPVIIEVKAPSNLFVEDDWTPQWLIPIKKDKSDNDILSVKYIVAIWHYVGNKSRIEEFSNDLYEGWIRSTLAEYKKLKRKKSETKSKMLTLYHGTSENALRGIIESKRIYGTWSEEIEIPDLYAIDSYLETSNNPIIIKARVPKSKMYSLEFDMGHPEWWISGERSYVSLEYVTHIYVFIGKLSRVSHTRKHRSSDWKIVTINKYIKTLKSKLITLYHGSSSSHLAKINKSKIIKGWWTQFIDKANVYAIAPHTKENFEDRKSGLNVSISKGYPIILECKVPESWFKEGYEDQTLLTEPKMKPQTLSFKHLTACYHYKNYTILDSIDDEFNFVRKHWVRNKMFKEIKTYVPTKKK